MVRSLVASWLAASALLVVVGTAGAHTGAPAAVVSAPPPPAKTTVVVPVADLRAGAQVPAPLAVFVAAAIIVAACASRRRLAIALVLVTAAFGVDAAVHSVHHLTDPNAAAACVLASNVSHAPAVLTDGPPIVVRPAPARDGCAAAGPTYAAVGVSRPDRGRAPPSSSSA